MNKILLSLFLILFSSFSYAKCTIYFVTAPELKDTILSKGLLFENYDTLCKKLNENDAGVQITNYLAVSAQQTTAVIQLRLYNMKVEKDLVSMASIVHSKTAKNRSTSENEVLEYKTTIEAFDFLFKSNALDLMIDQIDQLDP